MKIKEINNLRDVSMNLAKIMREKFEKMKILSDLFLLEYDWSNLL